MRIGGRGMKVVNHMPFKDILKITQMAVSRFRDCGLTRIGGGKFGDVYLYIDSNSQKYAIKVWKVYYDNEDHDIENLLRLQGSKYFPKIYMYKKRSFLVMEYFDGRTLAEIFSKHDRERADKIGKPAIKYIHDGNKSIEEAFKFAVSRGLAPNDTHGNNIIVTKEGELKFIDVGLFEELKVRYHRWHDYNGKVVYNNNKDLVESIKRDITNCFELEYAKGQYQSAFNALVEQQAKELASI